MFQRKAKTYRAAAFDGPEKIDTFKLARLFEEAAEETAAPATLHRYVLQRE